MEVYDASWAVACVFTVMAAMEGKVGPSSRQSQLAGLEKKRSSSQNDINAKGAAFTAP